MNHEAINFLLKMLKLLDQKQGQPKTPTTRATLQSMLAEGYLADGKVPEAKEVVLSALAVLDRPVSSSAS